MLGEVSKIISYFFEFVYFNNKNSRSRSEHIVLFAKGKQYIAAQLYRMSASEYIVFTHFGLRHDMPSARYILRIRYASHDMFRKRNVINAYKSHKNHQQFTRNSCYFV